MANALLDALTKQAIAKRLKERMEPQYRTDIDPNPQGYTEEVSRQVPDDVILPDMDQDENATAFDKEPVFPRMKDNGQGGSIAKEYYHPKYKNVRFSPEDVELTDNGTFRVKTWSSRLGKKAKRLDQILSQYPTTTRKVPTYTDANFKKTETRPAADLSKPEDVQSLTSEIVQMGGKPTDYGMPTVADAMKLPGELAKQKSERQGDFKTAVQVQKVFQQFNMPYDTKKSYWDNWNDTVQQLDPEMKAKFIQAGIEAINPKTENETALQQNAKYLAEQMGITEQEAAERLQHLKGKTKQQHVLDVYQSGMARHGDDKIAQEEAAAAGAFYDSVNGAKKPSLREDINQSKQGQKAPQNTVMSKSGKPMVKDPSSPTGWSYAQ